MFRSAPVWRSRSANSLRQLAWWCPLIALLMGCRIAAPSGELTATAVWYGTWTSEQRALVNGQVSFRLPDPLPAEGEFLVPARFETAMLLLSMGQPTAEVEMAMEVEPLTAEDLNHDQGETEASSQPEVRVTLRTEGTFGVEDQVVIYQAVLNRNDEAITGHYTSESPVDRGRFRVEREADAVDESGAVVLEAP